MNLPIGVLKDLPPTTQRALLEAIADDVLVAEVDGGRVELAAAVMLAAIHPKWDFPQAA